MPLVPRRLGVGAAMLLLLGFERVASYPTAADARGENAVDRYRLDAPIRVYHSPVDEEVPFEEVLVSVDRLRDRGAEVTVRTLPGFDHVNSWIQAMPRAVRYFGSR
jgi:hypothetical protein